jgi:hypothetical protein
MKAHCRYLIYAFLLLIMFQSCRQAVLKDEVVYQNYSLKQLRGYLNGDWISKSEINKANNKVFRRFMFHSDSSGFFENYEQRANGNVMMSDPPFFEIHKERSKYRIEFTFIFGGKHEAIYIKTITNRRLVLSVGEDTEVYEKINLQK